MWAWTRVALVMSAVGRGPPCTRFGGLAAAAPGFVPAAAGVRPAQPLLLIPAAIALGACYGMLLVTGLTRVKALAAPRDLAGAAAAFCCLSYLGLAAPYMRAALNGPVPSADSFLLAALGVALLISATASRRHCRAARGEALLHSVSPPTAHGDATHPACGTRSLS